MSESEKLHKNIYAGASYLTTIADLVQMNF